MKRASWSTGLRVTADGVGMVAHTGSIGLRLLDDRTGLTGQLSRAMARASFVPVHDRGQVLVDIAMMLVSGGEAMSDIEVLRHQDDALGPVSPIVTVWRTPDAITPGRAKKVGAARARGVSDGLCKGVACLEGADDGDHGDQ